MIEKIVKDFIKKPHLNDRDMIMLENKIKMMSIDVPYDLEKNRHTLPELDKRYI